MTDGKGGKHVSGSTVVHFPQIFEYIMEHINDDDVSKELRKKTELAPRAQMMGSPDEAHFLGFLVKVMGAKKVVEVGVFRGSTSLIIAKSLPEDGVLYALDITDEFVLDFGVPAWEAAGVQHKIHLEVGPAAESMQKLLDSGLTGQVDLVFIDADKTNYDTYYELALQLLKPNGVIAVDNVLWHGEILKPAAQHDPDTKAIVTLNEKIKHDDRVEGVMLGIADGVYLVRKRQETSQNPVGLSSLLKFSSSVH